MSELTQDEWKTVYTSLIEEAQEYWWHPTIRQEYLAIASKIDEKYIVPAAEETP